VVNPAPATARTQLRPEGSRLIKFYFAEELPVISHGRGVFVYDTEGRRYLDGCSGAMTANLGHGDPDVLRAMCAQAEQITFAHRGAFHNEQSERLADRLSDLTGYPYVFLCNSGSEAVETALRLTLQYWRERGESQRSRFVSHSISYHGATLGGLSLSGHPQRRWVAEALLHGFDELTPPYAYRFADGRDDATFTAALADGAARVLDSHGATAAGVVVEPISGAAGGAITPPDGYLPALAGLCRERGVPLIADEIMTGLGRTGRILATRHWEVRPAMVVLGKGMGAGYAPVSAVLVDAEVVDTIAAGTASVTTGHTYGGNPLGSAVALAVLDAVESRGLVANAAARGTQLRAGLVDLAQRHQVIGEVRGLGLLQGVELVSDRETRKPGDPVGSLTHALVLAARDHGLLVYPAASGANDAILVAPPLTVTVEEIDLLLDLLDSALTAMAASARPAA
jgi:adenosylmethionine-8-amino-7-oxononanoate aminotransferase